MKTVFFFFIIGIFPTCVNAQGRVGIGTINPATGLHVADSSVVFTASGLADANANKIPITGPGRRMMWYVDKSAFRAGYAEGGEWNAVNIGPYSMATGYGTKASGLYTATLGHNTTATAEAAMAIGTATTASGNNSFATGFGTIASGGAGAALGNYNEASGFVSAAFGNYTNAIGAASASFGDNTVAKANHSFSIGVFNEIATDMAGASSASTDRIFQIGNGNGVTRRNAVTVLRNGNFGIGVLTPEYPLDINGRLSLRYNNNTAGIWHRNSNNVETVFTGMKTDAQWGVYNSAWKFYFDMSNGEAYKTSGSTSWIVASDARLKENVHPYLDGLEQVMQINPVWFNYKKQSGFIATKPYVGVVAQELQETAPYMVGTFTKDNAELLNVDNSAMTYMLINAVKEQQQQIELLKREMEKLKK